MTEESHMYSLFVERDKGYRVRISSTHQSSLTLFLSRLHTEEKYTFLRPQKKVMNGVREKVPLREVSHYTQQQPLFYSPGEGVALLDRGLWFFLAENMHLWQKECEMWTIREDDNLQEYPRVNLVNHWCEDLYSEQVEDVRVLLSLRGGIAAQFTGFGKTRCLLACVESFISAHYRCVILVPTTGILQEICNRGQEFSLPISQYEWRDGVSINILNPKGFLRSKTSRNHHAQEWLSHVDVVIMDEVHNASAKSYTQFIRECTPEVRYIYGFSASPDPERGRMLLDESCERNQKYDSLSTMGTRLAKIIGLSGPVRIVRKPRIPVKLIKVFGRVHAETVREQTWGTALSTTLTHPRFVDMIIHILQQFPDEKFYIPIHNIKSGYLLYEQILERGILGVFWCEKFVRPVLPHKWKKSQIVEHVKYFTTQPEFRFLMTTSSGFEGVDIPSLSGVIPLTGTYFRMTIQPAGRSARGNTLLYILIYDTSNPLVLSQAKKRLGWIERDYTIIETSRITFQFID